MLSRLSARRTPLSSSPRRRADVRPLSDCHHGPSLAISGSFARQRFPSIVSDTASSISAKCRLSTGRVPLPYRVAHSYQTYPYALNSSASAIPVGHHPNPSLYNNRSLVSVASSTRLSFPVRRYSKGAKGTAFPIIKGLNHHQGVAAGRRPLALDNCDEAKPREFSTEHTEMYTASFAFFEAIGEAGITHCFVNLGSDHPSIIEAMVKGQREKSAKFPKIITCPNEVSYIHAPV
jgi:hypothetical protein